MLERDDIVAQIGRLLGDRNFWSFTLRAGLGTWMRGMRQVGIDEEGSGARAGADWFPQEDRELVRG